ncbi:MAG: transposase [Desulfurivibrionaceae bacterium]|nr:transposase [Desulfurivibrionaceae bacterium]
MVRPLRIQYPGAVYHVTSRGNERKAIFSDDEDRARFLDILCQSVKTYDIKLHGFVLMLNHFHLQLETPLGNLGEFMRHFNITYTSHYNRRHNRSGHLYQGRYKSVLVDRDAYMSQVSRYIHLNPVRVKAVREMAVKDQLNLLWEYKWSSLPGYLDLKVRQDFIECAYILEEFGGDTLRGRTAYGKQLVLDLVEGLSIKEKIVGQSVLGDESFSNWVKENYLEGIKDRECPAVAQVHSYATKSNILAFAGEILGIRSGNEMLAAGLERSIMMDLLYRFGGLKNNQIGELFGVDYSTVSQGRKRLRERTARNKNTRDLVEKIEHKLSQIKN